MHPIIERLQSGERWRAADVATRLIGGLFLLLAAYSAWVLRGWMQGMPRSSALLAACTPSELGLAVVAFVSLVAALAFLIEGAGLFRLVPYPRRRLF